MYNKEFFEKVEIGRPGGTTSKFASRLRILRKKKGYTQEEVSTKLGLSKVTYGTYEISRYTPDADKIARLADFYNVSADYLLGLSDEPSLTTNVNSGGDSNSFPFNFSKKCADVLLDISKSSSKTRTFEAMISSKSFEKLLAYMNTYLQFSEKLEKSDKEQYQEAYKRATIINVSTNDYLSVDAYPDGGVKVADVYLSLIQESLKSILDDIAKENKEYYKKEMIKIVSEEASKQL